MGNEHGQGTGSSTDGEKYSGEMEGWKELWSRYILLTLMEVSLCRGIKRMGKEMVKEHSLGLMEHKYVGKFKDGKEHGQGTWTSTEGEKYVGKFKDGKKHGQGTYTWSDGMKVCWGIQGWRIHDGQGTYTWSDERKYVGKWKNGKYNGQGTFTYPYGEKYLGKWKDGERNGQGILYFPRW